jgi:hypothetical protein
MGGRKFSGFAALCVAISICTACVSGPNLVKPQFAPWHYAFSVLLAPDQPGDTPQLELAMSLLQVKYPEELAEYLNGFLYQAAGPDEYKDKIIEKKRDEYRQSAVADIGRQGVANHNWHYSEIVGLKNEQLPQTRGIVIEREIESFSGGAHPDTNRYYYVLDLESRKQVGIDDLFADFRGDSMRSIIFAELRRYGNLSGGQPLSEGIFFSDEPELTFNFFVTEAGFGLYWNRYEIAPYYVGGIGIILPWRDIVPFLKSGGMEILAKFDIRVAAG